MILNYKDKFLKIFKEKAVINGDIINVTSFLNHLVDYESLSLIVDYFSSKLQNIYFDKLITVESSGIIFTSAMAYKLKKPFIIVKKKLPVTIKEFYNVKSYSFTKQETTSLYVSKEVLKCGEKLVFVDDFYAHGNTLKALKEICREVQAEIVTSLVVVNKSDNRDIISLISKEDLINMEGFNE